MLKRTLSALVLLLVGFPAVLLGGLPYFLLIGFFLAASAWEYADMFKALELRPARPLIVGTVLAIGAVRTFHYSQFGASSIEAIYASIPIFTISILLAMAIHVIEYERGREKSALDFAATLGGLAYLGWIGGYLIDLRALPNGGWWLMFVLPTVWMADTGAFMIGASYGCVGVASCNLCAICMGASAGLRLNSPAWTPVSSPE